MADLDLRTLDAETWGERVARARDRSGISLKEAAKRISRFVPVSYTTVMRLESFTEEPDDVKRRMVAFLALVVYGYDPTDFGLSPDDLPRRFTEKGLGDLQFVQSPWTTASARELAMAG